MVTLELSEVVVYGLDVVTQVVEALQHQATFIAGLGLVLWWHLKKWKMMAQLDTTTEYVFLCMTDLYQVVSSTLILFFIAKPPYFIDLTAASMNRERRLTLVASLGFLLLPRFPRILSGNEGVLVSRFLSFFVLFIWKDRTCDIKHSTYRMVVGFF